MLGNRILTIVKISAAAVLLGLTIIGLSGCSNNPYPASDAGSSVLYRTIPLEPKTLDPSVCYISSDSQIVALLYPSYFRYHYLKRNPFVLELNQGAVEPTREAYTYQTKEHGSTVTKQGEMWTFRIKKGLKFQDDPAFPGGKGREIRAADYIYSLKRMADPTVPCPVLSYFEGTVLGLHEYAEYNRGLAAHGKPADYKRPVAGLQLDPKDPYTFRVILTHPYPQLRYLMAMPFTTPIAHEATEKYKADFSRHPVGSGLYVLDHFSPKLEVVLKKNPNRNPEYYPTEGAPGDREAGLLKDAGKELPFTDKIVFRIIKESLTAWNLFMQGYLDAGSSTDDFNPTSVSQVMTTQGGLSKDMIERGVGLTRSPNANVWYMAFNMKDPVVGGYDEKHKKLRQAISMAFNTQQLMDLALRGYGTKAQFLIPPGVAGYDPKYRNPYCDYNLDKAKKLLAEAGYPNGIDAKTGDRLTIYYDNYATGAGGQNAVGIMAKMFTPLGINLESRSYQYPIWYDRVKSHDYQFTLEGWIADYPDPENFALLLYGPNAANKGPNDNVYNNPEYNRLFEQMQTMDDGPKREEIIRKMRDVAVEDTPCIYMYHDDSLTLYNKWLSNVKPHPVANDFVKYYRVDGPLRARMQREWNQPNYWPLIIIVGFFTAGTLPALAVVRKRRNRRLRVSHGGNR